MLVGLIEGHWLGEDDSDDVSQEDTLPVPPNARLAVRETDTVLDWENVPEGEDDGEDMALAVV